MPKPKPTYLTFDPSLGFPTGKYLFYECGICGDVIPSRPEHSVTCSCNNLAIDADAGRLSCKDQSKLRLFKLRVKTDR
jgi:hypothetical protein